MEETGGGSAGDGLVTAVDFAWRRKSGSRVAKSV